MTTHKMQLPLFSDWESLKSAHIAIRSLLRYQGNYDEQSRTLLNLLTFKEIQNNDIQSDDPQFAKFVQSVQLGIEYEIF